VIIEPGSAAVEQRRGFIDAVRENSSRLATCFAAFTTQGWGELESPTVTLFTTTFVERPSVSYGCNVDGAKLGVGRFPRSHGGVSRWLRDNNGYYVGAWLFMVVDTIGPNYGPINIISSPVGAPPQVNYTVYHDFTFIGTAMKDIPQALLGPGVGVAGANAVVLPPYIADGSPPRSYDAVAYVIVPGTTSGPSGILPL